MSEELINVIDPGTGEMGSLPQAQLSEAQQQGYQVATPEQAAQYKEKQSYTTPGQRILSSVEGALTPLTLGILPAIEKHSMLTTYEDIQKRREYNPDERTAGEVGSFALPLIGEAAGAGRVLGGGVELMERLGAGAANSLGLTGKSVLQKMGSSAVKNAVISSAFTGNDEIAKAIEGDPEQTLGSAATRIGLSGLIGLPFGAGIGAVAPMWEAAAGSKVAKVLGALKDRMGGLEGDAPDVIRDAMKAAGTDLPPEVQTLMRKDPIFHEMAETLRQSDTTGSGAEFQKTIQESEKKLANVLVESVGKSSQEPIIPKSDISTADAGKKLGDTLAKELKQRVGPISEGFEAVKEKLKDIELPQDTYVGGGERLNPNTLQMEPISAEMVPGVTTEAAEKIANLAQSEGWATMMDSEIMSFVQKVLKNLPKQKTLGDMNKFISQVGNEGYDIMKPQMSRAAMMIKNILSEPRDALIIERLGAEGPGAVTKHQGLREAWKAASELKESLNSRLRIRGGDSLGSFVKNLEEMIGENPERVIERLSGKNDSSILQVLQEHFPGTAQALREFHLNEALGKAAEKASDGYTIHPQTFLKNMNSMSPELRSFVASPEAQTKMAAVEKLLEGLESKNYNFSNTARTVDKLWSDVPGSAAGLVTALMTHNPLGFLISPLVKLMGRDVPDAVRLSLLKFASSGAPVDAGAFKSMVDYLSHVSDGQTLINKAVKSLVKGGASVIPSKLIPDERRLEKLDQHLQKMAQNPGNLIGAGGKMGHYLPDHGSALGKTAAQSVQYLNEMRPRSTQSSPLDSKIEPSKAETAAYHRQLTIAEQPLVILEHIQNGTVIPQDVHTMQVVYPGLYRQLSNKIHEAVIETASEGKNIPYEQRMGMSMFLATPLDSTMTPMGIQSHQIANKTDLAPSQQSTPVKPNPSSPALNKMSGRYMTAGQSAESGRLK